MFGLYELQLPSGWHARLTEASNRFSGGHWGAVVLMGMLSAAIVSPCVAAPLAGALLYIGQTRDTVLGGTALFSMAMGMGVPLVLVGVSEGLLLPKSGHWMRAVKQFFGVLLLGVAIWIVSPVIPVAVQMLAWAALLIGSGVFLRALDPLPGEASGWTRMWKAAGIFVLLLGVAEGVGALSGGKDPLRPLAGLIGDSAEARPPQFEPVRSLADVEGRLRSGGPALLDFYADWCVSCKEMERFTFSDPQVQSRLAGMTVAAHRRDGKQCRRQGTAHAASACSGRPGIVFFDAGGREIEGLRVIGYQSPEKFMRSLDLARL